MMPPPAPRTRGARARAAAGALDGASGPSGARGPVGRPVHPFVKDRMPVSAMMMMMRESLTKVHMHN